MTIKAVVFDLDSTLCEYQISSFQALRMALEQLNQQSVWDQHPEIFSEQHWSASLDALWNQSDDCISSGHTAPKFPYGANIANAHHLLQQAGMTDNTLLEEITRACLTTLMNHLTFCPGAEPVVGELSENYVLGLVTNGPSELQWGKINHLGIRDWFGAIVVSHDIGIVKPDPRIFDPILEKLNVSASESVYVGDTLKYDILGAHNAGMKSVWVNPKGFPFDPKYPKPDVKIDHLSQLPEWLKGPNPMD